MPPLPRNKKLPDEYEFFGMADLYNEPTIDWLIRGWLPAREISCVWGQPGSFKSFVAQGWSLQLAAAGKKTVYVAAEGASGLASRVAAWNALNHGQDDRVDENWHYMPSNVNLQRSIDRARWEAALIEYLGGLPDLVVVDTLARNFVGGDENSPRDMGEFVEGIEELRRNLDSAILVIHHSGVTTGRERGTAALRAATFAMFKTGNLRSTEKGVSVAVECDRMKDADFPKDIRVDFHRVSMGGEYGDVLKESYAMKKFPSQAQRSRRERSRKKERAK